MSQNNLTKLHHKEDARAFYLECKSIAKVAQKFGIVKSTAHVWCLDLIKANKANNPPKPKKTKTIKKPYVPNKERSLTLEQVVSLRKLVRKNGYFDLTVHAKSFNVNHATIAAALKGECYKDADALEPPITEKLPPRYIAESEKKKRRDLVNPLIEEMIGLRRQDPTRWTYGELAQRMSEKTGQDYRATHVARLLTNRDPSLKELESKQPPAPRKKRDPETLKKEALARAEQRKADRLAYIKMLAMEDQYEKNNA